MYRFKRASENFPITCNLLYAFLSPVQSLCLCTRDKSIKYNKRQKGIYKISCYGIQKSKKYQERFLTNLRNCESFPNLFLSNTYQVIHRLRTEQNVSR